MARRLWTISLAIVLALAVGTVPVARAATFNIADGDVAGLIAAINTANGNGVADTINLTPGGTYTLTTVDPSNVCSSGATGLPSITSQITINGNGATIQRSAAVGIPFFRIFCVSGNLTLNDVTVSGGGSPTATSFAGSVLKGGGISTRFGFPALVTLNNSTVSGNTVTSTGGGINIESNATLILNSSTVSGNTAGVMPGSGTGGGIRNEGSATITNSTVSGNTATSNSGGILNFGGTLTLTNSTVSGNAGQFGAGGIRNSFGTMTIKNTIVANSTSGDDCAGVIMVEGNNFVESPGACVIVGSGTVNGGFDPLLGPLAENGGPTQTHALLPGSPAIDAVPVADCAVSTDQRGVVRPQGAGCDIGAYEYYVSNLPPVADANGPYMVQLGATVTLDGGLSTDPDGDLLEYRWDFDGDGIWDTGWSASPTEDTQYTAVGVYSAVLSVRDPSGAESTDNAIVVVYDPSAGFVTGGGWVYSEAGADKLNPSAEGKATFGFVSKYKKGANVPTGQTEFQFKAGDLNFHSTKYQWLVVNQGGTNAQYKGTGTINGTGEYKFMLWAGDGDPDTFRIKIWTEDGGEVVVYDNGFDQTIAGGSIVIHKSKK